LGKRFADPCPTKRRLGLVFALFPRTPAYPGSDTRAGARPPARGEIAASDPEV